MQATQSTRSVEIVNLNEVLNELYALTFDYKYFLQVYANLSHEKVDKFNFSMFYDGAGNQNTDTKFFVCVLKRSIDKIRIDYSRLKSDIIKAIYHQGQLTDYLRENEIFWDDSFLQSEQILEYIFNLLLSNDFFEKYYSDAD